MADERNRRPRVVNACDYCRRKKTRCKFQSDRNVCDACAAAHVRCTFEDRERHQAVRDQHYAFVLAPPGPDLLAASDAGGQQSVGSSTFTPLGSEGASMASFRYDEVLSTTTPPPMPPLFDPSQPSQPNPALLPGLIPAYYQFVHPSIPIVSNETVMSGYMRSTLPAPLANALAALAAPYSIFMPELSTVDVNAAAQAYLAQAERLLQTEANVATVPNVQALVLVARAEMQANRAEQSRPFAQRAIQLAVQLGLSNEGILAQLATSEEELTCLRNLRDNIVTLHRSLTAASQTQNVAQ